MTKTIGLLCIILLFFSCTKEKEEIIPVEIIPGGAGGSFNVAIFPLNGKFGVSGKCYIRYGCKTIPASATSYNDSSATMTEPGYGPHVHFINLKEGFYLISAKGNYTGNAVRGDTIIEITGTQSKSVDCKLQVR